MQDIVKKKTAFSSLIESTISTILPHRCAATGEIVDIKGTISPNFWAELEFIEHPFCKKCGIPFEFDMGENIICASCMDIDPMFDETRSAVVYNDASRRLILNFKFNDKINFVHTFTPWLLRAGSELIDKADFIIPVPLHPKKLRQRRFNQSALLAHEVSKKAHRVKNYLPDGLIRTRNTIPQKGLNRKERNENIIGAFAINDNHLDSFTHKNILLIDDVLTTGSTLNECARILKNAGSKTVNILTIARVTKEGF